VHLSIARWAVNSAAAVALPKMQHEAARVGQYPAYQLPAARQKVQILQGADKLAVFFS